MTFIEESSWQGHLLPGGRSEPGGSPALPSSRGPIVSGEQRMPGANSFGPLRPRARSDVWNISEGSADCPAPVLLWAARQQRLKRGIKRVRSMSPSFQRQLQRLRLTRTSIKPAMVIVASSRLFSESFSCLADVRQRERVRENAV